MAKMKIFKKVGGVSAKRHIKKLHKKKSKTTSPKINIKKYFQSSRPNNSFRKMILYYKNRLFEPLNTVNIKTLPTIKKELKIINMIYNYIPMIANLIPDNIKLSIFKNKFISLTRFLTLNDLDFTILTLYIDKILNEKCSLFTWENLFILGICSKAKTDKKYELFLQEISANNSLYNQLFHLLEPTIEEIKQRYDSLLNKKVIKMKKEINENAVVSAILEENKATEIIKNPASSILNLDINIEQVVNKEELKEQGLSYQSKSKVLTEENVDKESEFGMEENKSQFSDEFNNKIKEYFFGQKEFFDNNEEDLLSKNNSFFNFT